MPTSSTAAVPRPPRPAGPRTVPNDRRTRRRLRGLCDEVLASYRVASGRDPLTDEDRRAARALLAGLAPLPRG
ncbi:MAG TPA: hypothetical protein VFS08_01255 [Gemmatimonadaceae bacterium]|nr:hypothetical protein [Gemmatimonadaceae bacterium]